MSPYSIGSDHWPGLSKLSEECGEVLQVVGKIQGLGKRHDEPNEHWDGSELRVRLTEELGDVMAALRFVAERCGLDAGAVERRAHSKQGLFDKWHEEQRARSVPGERGRR